MSDELIAAARELSAAVGALSFSSPTTHVYNPLAYAWRPHERYLARFGRSKKRVVLLGMNPGPFGMAQTGVPFGEVSLVRDWMGICEPVEKPAHEHPKRPVLGFDCNRSEVSGKRLWGAIAARYPKPEAFFKDHFVINYCPLVFMEESGRNRTPDKLLRPEREALDAACDRHLDRALRALAPAWLMGVGTFARDRLLRAKERLELDANVACLPHPSPASPKANADWVGAARRELEEQGAPVFL